MTIRLRLLLGFSTLIVIFIVVFFINKRLSDQVMRNSDYLNNSEMVMRNSNKLHKEMIEMQSGFRGFLLTGQDAFLSSYYDGLKSVPVLFKEQRSILSTSRQKEKLDSISLLHKDWVEYADSLITTKKDTMREAGIRYKRLFDKKLKMEVGKKLNDKIGALFLSFNEYEYDLRQKRRKALKASISSTRNISLSLTIFSLLIAAVTGFYVIRTITSRISKMVNLSERISRGEFIVLGDDKSDELSRLVKSLNQMSKTLEANFKELKKTNNELDEFAYVVSHDLKAPLRGIANIISWIEEDHEGDLTADIEQKLELIKGRTVRLENMINGLLEYARVGKVTIGPEQVNLHMLLEDLKEVLVPRSVTWVVHCPIAFIYAEKLHLEQVFSNLVGNAVKHNKSLTPIISISCQELADHYKFTISDNGPGIEPEYHEKIFMIFQTLQERDAFESTGVGLAIVKKIMDDNKSTIHVRSELGKGTTFTFTWPKIKEV